jgi:hypothetical protein
MALTRSFGLSVTALPVFVRNDVAAALSTVCHERNGGVTPSRRRPAATVGIALAVSAVSSFVPV